VLLAQRNLPAAMTSYQAGLAITRVLVKSDPANAGWQRDLGISYEKIGDVQMAQGDLPEALKSYRDEFAIMDRLAKANPSSAFWQRSQAVSYSKLGDVLTKQGKTKDAVENYRLALAIMERLAAIDATNRQWQAVLVEYNYDLAINGDDSARRFAYVAASLTKLQSEMKLSAEQAGWLAEAQTRLAKLQSP
jgi:tetratricopeptide (TPR) repeat protein